MKFNIKELLDFFDDKKDSQKGDANALMSILGEDLNASVYKHFRKNEIDILKEPVVQGFKGGKYLDRWILDKKNNKLFQCEIKNWAATAIGGRQLKSDAEDTTVKEISFTYYWSREIKNNFSKENKHPNMVTKVLLTMRKPKGYENFKIEPLLIYWMPVTSDKKGLNPMSIFPINLPMESNFSKLNIFSVSLYLRQLYKKGEGQKIIDLDEMLHFEHRIMLINRFKKISNENNFK